MVKVAVLKAAQAVLAVVQEAGTVKVQPLLAAQVLQGREIMEDLVE